MSDSDHFKVAVSVIGRFHAFDLARQLHQRGELAQLLTTYPKFMAARWGIPGELVSSSPWQLAARKAYNKIPGGLRSRWNPHYFFTSSFDRFAARRLREGADLFVGWSGVSLRALRRARSLGMLTVIDRGGSHIVYATRILEEEYARRGLKFAETPREAIEQEVREYAEADYIAIPGSFARRSFVEMGVSEEKLICVPYGTDLSMFHPVKKEDDVFRVIHCGALSLQKGVPYLLQAFAELDLPRAELWLVGGLTEEVRPVLAQYARPSIIFHGPQPHARLNWFYSQADVFCLMSVQEGWGMVLAEAMACGLPVICSANTAAEDIAQDGVEGYIVPIRDVEALKARIKWCYEHREECAAMGRAARQRVSQGFSWDNYGEKMHEAYGRALRARGRIRGGG